MYCKPCIRVLGYLLVDIWVETALGPIRRQVPVPLTSSALDTFSAKCTLCSFNSSTSKLVFEYTSPCKLGLCICQLTQVYLKLSWWMSPLFRRTSAKATKLLLLVLSIWTRSRTPCREEKYIIYQTRFKFEINYEKKIFDFGIYMSRGFLLLWINEYVMETFQIY